MFEFISVTSLTVAICCLIRFGYPRIRINAGANDDCKKVQKKYQVALFWVSAATAWETTAIARHSPLIPRLPPARH